VKHAAVHGLDADHARVRFQCLDDRAYTREQSAATDGNDDGVEVGRLLDDLEPHGALSAITSALSNG
jgi:hypothetical protein